MRINPASCVIVLAGVGVLAIMVLLPVYLSDVDDGWKDEGLLSWSMPLADCTADGTADHLVCASHFASYQAIEIHGSALLVVDGANGALLEEPRQRLGSLLEKREHLLGAGSGDVLPDPWDPERSLLVIYYKEVVSFRDEEYRDRIAVFELPSLQLRGSIACGTHSWSPIPGRMLPRSESSGLPDDRLLLLSSRIVLLSLRSMAVLDSVEWPVNEADPVELLDVDGDGERDRFQSGKHERLLVHSARTGQELAYGSMMSVNSAGTSFQLASESAPETMFFNVLMRDDETRLVVSKQSALGEVQLQHSLLLAR